MENKEIIKNLGDLASDAYNNAIFNGTESPNVPGYIVKDISSLSINGFQALLLLKTDSNTPGSQYVLAFRGTEFETCA